MYQANDKKQLMNRGKKVDNKRKCLMSAQYAKMLSQTKGNDRSGYAKDEWNYQCLEQSGHAQSMKQESRHVKQEE